MVGVGVSVGSSVGGTAVLVIVAKTGVVVSAGVGGLGKISRVETSVGSGSAAANSCGFNWQPVRKTAVQTREAQRPLVNLM